MLETLAGSPFPLVAATACITGILLFMYFHSQDSRLLPCIGVALALTLAPLLIDALIVTDREAIKQTVQRIARSVRQNDLPATMKFAHPDSPQVLRAIEQEMPNYEFSMCNIAGFREIAIGESGKDAKVTFRVYVNVKAKRGPEGLGDREIVLDLRKDARGQWKITDYTHYDPRRRDFRSRGF